MSRTSRIFVSRGFVYLGGLLLLLTLACQVGFNGKGLVVDTGSGNTVSSAASPAMTAMPTLPATTAAVPFGFPGAPPVVQPTPVPRHTPRPGATATPRANTGGQGGQGGQGVPTSGGPTIASEIWDFPTGAHARPQGGVYYAAGGDVYDFNLYERPFPEQSQNAFYPDLDIRYARLVRSGDWFFAALRLHGLPQGGTAPGGDYGVELDVDLDGRGEYLVWAKGPVPNTWTPQGIQVLRDAHPDVEGPRACTSDAPFRGDGYDQVRYTAEPATGLAWLMWGWDREGGKTYPAVYLAFHRSLLDGHDDKMLWQAWADGGLRQPAQMTYHDRYTRPEAGSPYRGDPDFPIRAIARVDNTCRAAFGFQPTGLEPCLCEASTTVQLCPIPETPPAPGCVPDGPGTWSCPFQTNEGGGRLAMPDAQDSNFYCVWDPELCQWSCRSERICLPFSEDEAAQRLIPVLPFGDEHGDREGMSLTCYQTALGCSDSLPGLSLGPGTPKPPTPPAGSSGIGIPSGIMPGDTIRLNVGDLSLRQGDDNRLCQWDANLCRWQCRDEQCVLFDPGPNCEALPDGAYKCVTEGEIALTTICRADLDACRWECRPEGQVCPAPDESPSAACQPMGDGRWSCTSEIGVTVCQWDTDLCQWQCESDRCQVPNQDCALDSNTEHWVCPGKGEFEGCQWSVNDCRWKCWNPIRPQPTEEPGGGDQTQCQSAEYCSLDGEIWYCDDGNAYNSCEYDGCVWTCK